MADRISGTLQENLLALLAHNEEHGRVVSKMVTASEFEGDYRVVAERCIDYWAKHDQAPGVHMPDILSEIVEDQKHPKQKSYRRILHGLLDIAPQVNTKYVLDRLHAYKREQQLTKAIIETAGMLATKKELAIGEVEEHWQNVLRSVPVEFDAGRRLDEFEVVLEYLQKNFSEFTTGVKELDRAGVVPYRGALMILIAVKGHGKSWWLINLGRHAIIQRKKVVHLSLEMSEEEIMLRYYQCLWTIPLREAERIAKTQWLDIRDNEVVAIKPVEVKADITFENRTIAQELEIQLLERAHAARNIRIKRFPPQTLTPNGIRAYLDNLELTEGFIPDMLIVDYAGLMKTDPNNQRIDIGRNVMELRGIGVERNMAVVTAHQSSKEGAKAKSVRSVHVSEDWSVVHTADTILTFSATEQEKSMGLGRLYVEHNRSQKDHWGVVLTQALSHGKFVRQSARLPSDYWEQIKVQEEDEDEEAEDSA